MGYAIMRVLIDREVIGDFRETDLLRFGFTSKQSPRYEIREH